MESYTWLQENYMLDEEQAAAIEWQFGFCGDFRTALWNVIKVADGGNLILLARSFPVEVSAYAKYTQLENWWLDIEKRVERYHSMNRQAIDEYNREKRKAK